MVEYPHRLALVATLISLNVQPAFAEDLSADLIMILEEATASNDQTTIDIVSRTLIAAFPENEDAILAYLEAAPAAGTSDDVLESLDLTATTETKKGDPWEGDLSLYGVALNGASNSNNYGFKLDMSREFDGFVRNFGAMSAFTQADGEEKEHRWRAYYQLDNALGDMNRFFYYRASFDFDRFAKFEQRLFLGGGYGQTFVDTDRWSLHGELGPGLFVSRKADATANDLSAQAAVFSSLAAELNLTETVSLDHRTEANWSGRVSTVQSVSSLKTLLTERLTLGLSHETLFQSSTEQGGDRTDTTFRADVIVTWPGE